MVTCTGIRVKSTDAGLQFTFAHFSDVHLGPMPFSEVFRDFAFKRLLGGLSWHWRRKYVHSVDVAMALIDNVRAAQPDHLVFTGDLLNIASAGEFERAAKWLATLTEPGRLSFVPGNHDAYVPFPADFGINSLSQVNGTPDYPFVHLRRNIAFVGVSTAVPQSLFMAGGQLGPQQLNALRAHLSDLQARGFYRVLMIHHPPVPGLTKARKALTDAEDLRSLLMELGAELVLHGHNHERMLNWLHTSRGDVPICGVTSASANGNGPHGPAEWNLFTVDRSRGKWRTLLERHSYNPKTVTFERSDAVELRTNAAGVEVG
jgi:3',5'-cyclic AMP phosphodiesterase CpdA